MDALLELDCASLELTDTPDVVVPMPVLQLQWSASGSQAEQGRPQLPVNHRRQLLVSVGMCLGCLVNGAAIGYTAPAIPSLMDANGTDIYGNTFQVSSHSASWITSVLSLGAFGGSILAWPLMECWGRRLTSMVVVVPGFALGHLLIILANGSGMIITGRIVIGISMGLNLVITTTYLVEIASTDIRGTIGCLVQLLTCLGVFITFAIGAVVNWFTLALVCGLLMIPFGVALAFMPESPRFLVKKGKTSKALEVIQWLSGERVDPDLVQEHMDAWHLDVEESTSWMQLIAKGAKPLTLALILVTVASFSGLAVIVFYAVNIFEEFQQSVNASVSSILVGITLLVSSSIGTSLVSRINRRVLIITSLLLTSLFLALLALALLLNSQGDLGSGWHWLPITSVLGAILVGNGGYGTLLWIVVVEILPSRIRDLANSSIISTSFLLTFISSKTFIGLTESSLDVHGTFFMYALVCLVGALVLVFFLPETRNKSLEEIQKKFHRPWGRPTSFWGPVQPRDDRLDSLILADV